MEHLGTEIKASLKPLCFDRSISNESRLPFYTIGKTKKLITLLPSAASKKANVCLQLNNAAISAHFAYRAEANFGFPKKRLRDQGYMQMTRSATSMIEI